MNQKVVDSLTASHRLMERVLTLIRMQIVLLQPGDDEKDKQEAFAFLKNAIGYMHSYPGLMHHPAEDILFERLTQKTPDAHALCRGLRRQHQDFAEQETKLFGLIERAESGELEAYWRIGQMGLIYCAEHTTHITSEESEAFPLAAETLQPDDWTEVAEMTLRATDPLTSREAKARFDNLYDRLMAAGEDLAAN